MTGSPGERLRSVLAATRRSGVVSTALAAARRFGVAPHGFYYYYRARVRAPRGVAGVDPFRTLAVDPAEIEWLPKDRFDKWGDLGAVRGGEWDEPLLRFEETPTYRTLHQRYEQGYEWEETELYRSALSRLWRGKRGWQGTWTTSDLSARCEAVDDLYDRMRSEGYRSQTELTGAATADRLRRGDFRRYESEVSVHVARDGSLRFVDGRHRLAIAKLLGLDAVTVQPVVRHRRWQAHRRRVAENGIDAVAAELREHPDLADVRN